MKRTCEYVQGLELLSNVHSKIFFLLLVSSLATLIVGTAYGDQPINNRIEIDDDDIPSDIAAGDLFGYQIEKINDLDGDGVTDLATVKFSDDSGETDAGSILIMFMNSDGTVKSTNEIIQDGTAGNIDSNCIAPGTTNRDDSTLEQLAFVGDLDGDGEPTLAVGAANNEYGFADTGAIYNLELNSDGTVDNCFLIIPNNGTHTSGFAPSSGVYQESGSAFLGWPLIATDLNGDGQNELIAGATNEAVTSTNLWPLFLNSTGGVDSHPSTPIFAISDIGVDASDYLDDGDTLDTGTKIIVSAQSGGVGEGTVFIVNLDSSGGFTSSNEITGASLGVGIDASDTFGSGVSRLGDMDADGVNDVLVGNISGDDSVGNSGEAYILYMNSDDSVSSSQKISNLSTINESVSSFLSMTDLFGHGMELWTENGNEAMIAISAHQDNTGGGNAGAIHLFSITRNSETVVSTETTDTNFSVSLNDVTVGVTDSGTGTKSVTVEQLNSNPEPKPFPGNLVGFFYDITGTGSLNNVSIQFTYTDAEISELSESSLVLYRFTGGEWVALDTTVNEENNSATATTSGFSTFALSGSRGSFDSANGHGKQLDKKCKPDGFGKGKSLDVISLFITKEIGDLRGISVDLSTTCGPASVRVSNEYGTKIAGLSFQQSQYDDKKTIPVVKYITDIEGDSKKVTILAKDKRDIFIETLYLNSDRIEIKYSNFTGYTSKQQNSIEKSIQGTAEKNLVPEVTSTENIVFEPSLPSFIKTSLLQWSGYQSTDHFFFDAVTYLIDKDYIQFNNWQKSHSLQEELSYPEWVLNAVDFYNDEKLSDDELLEMIEYLINNRIVRIGR